MAWVRAVWQEEKREEEGVVPASWIVNDVLHWPKVNDSKKAMLDGRKPGDGKGRWRDFPVIKEKIRSGIPILIAQGHP
jgi:hypothetical protein